jgi:hypothetical protein
MTKDRDQEKTKTYKISSREFETTTKIRLEDTFDENEITLVDELPPPTINHNEQEEDSVTTKLNIEVTQREQAARPPRIKEPSSISYKIKKIEAGIGVKKESYFTKKCHEFTNAIKAIDLNKRTAKIAFLTFGSLILLLTLIIGSGYFFTSKKEIKTEKIVVFPKSEQLKLSPLEVLNTNGDLLNSKTITAGSDMYLKFNVTNFNVSAPEILKLEVAIRIFSNKGRLILYKPSFLRYTGKIDKETSQLEIKTKLDFHKDITLGYYRVVLDVTEINTQKQASLYGRFKVVP